MLADTIRWPWLDILKAKNFHDIGMSLEALFHMLNLFFVFLFSFFLSLDKVIQIYTFIFIL